MRRGESEFPVWLSGLCPRHTSASLLGVGAVSERDDVMWRTKSPSCVLACGAHGLLGSLRAGGA